MADVFISYARSDRKRIEPIAHRLNELGYQVWWDRGIVPGSAFLDDINRELDQARCVLVAWSKHSHASDWVAAESLRGLETDRLVQVCIEPIRLKVPFNAIHYADLTGGASDEDWQSLRQAIDTKLGSTSGTASNISHKAAAPPTIRAARLVGLISTVSILGLAVLVAIATAPLLPIPAMNDAYSRLGAAIAGLPPGSLYFGFGLVTALAGAALALTAQRVWAALRAGD